MLLKICKIFYAFPKIGIKILLLYNKVDGQSVDIQKFPTLAVI